MTLIRYRRHFVALGVATPLLWLPFAERLALPRGDRFFLFYFAWIGALHAVAIVVALRSIVPLRRAAAFVALAALWSFGTPALGMSLAYLGTFLGIQSGGSLIFLLLSASAFGASGYWFLVRWFWMPRLSVDELGSTVGLCVTATALSWAGMLVLKLLSPIDLSQLAPTLMWWVAFSVSLYRSETRTPIAVTQEVASA